jgi:hypothetical protein
MNLRALAAISTGEPANAVGDMLRASAHEKPPDCVRGLSLKHQCAAYRLT